MPEYKKATYDEYDALCYKQLNFTHTKRPRKNLRERKGEKKTDTWCTALCCEINTFDYALLSYKRKRSGTTGALRSARRAKDEMSSVRRARGSPPRRPLETR